MTQNIRKILNKLPVLFIFLNILFSFTMLISAFVYENANESQIKDICRDIGTAFKYDYRYYRVAILFYIGLILSPFYKKDKKIKYILIITFALAILSIYIVINIFSKG